MSDVEQPPETVRSTRGAGDTFNSRLLAAQKAIDVVAKDARNAFAKYDYTSCEVMIQECRKALHSVGLCCYRSGWDCSDGYVTSTFVVASETTERAFRVKYPIVVRKGMEADKASSASLSTSMSYFLRDLLLVPRGIDVEVDNAPPEQQAPQRRKASKPPKTAEETISEFTQRIKDAKDRNDLLQVYAAIGASDLQVSTVSALQAQCKERAKELNP